MALLRSLFGAEHETRSSVSSLFLSGNGAFSGTKVNEQTIMSKNDMVYRCIQILANSIATLPVDTLFKDETGASVQYPSPSWVNSPNPDENRFNFYQNIVVSLLLNGNAYILPILDGNGAVLETYVLNPVLIEVKRDTSGNKFYLFDGKERFSASQILHIRGLTGPAGDVGISPIESARSSLEAYQDIRDSAKQLAANGFRASGIVELPQGVSPEDVPAIAGTWNQAYNGIDKTGKTAFLFNGAKFTQLTMSNRDAEYVAQKMASERDVARLFGVPNFLLGISGDTTYSNISEANKAFLQFTLRPLMVNIEQAMSLLLPPGVQFKFNERQILRGTVTEESAALKTEHDAGIISANEWRSMKDYAPIEADWANERFGPMNYEQRGADIDKQIRRIEALISAGFTAESAQKAATEDDLSLLVSSNND